MYPNPLKQKIKSGQLVLGTMLPTHDIRIAAALAYACKADFIWLEQEHSPFGPRDLEMIPILLRQQGIAPMVRVAWNDPALIKKAYDAGAVSVMIPQVDNVAEAKLAIEYSNYPPVGTRGISPHWVGLAGLDFMEVVRTANDETVTILQMESVQAYEQVDEILALPGFDVLLVGPMDLSASMGITGQRDNARLQAIMQELPKRAAGTGKVIGTTLGSPAEMRQKIEWGYKFLNLENLLGAGIRFVNNEFKEYRAMVGQ